MAYESVRVGGAMPVCSRPVSTLSARPRRFALAVAALALASTVAAFQWQAIHRQSLTGDGSYHLLAGHQALRYGQNRLNLEHPPLVKLVAALPAALDPRPLAPPTSVEEALDASGRLFVDGERIHRETVRGRILVELAFVVPLLVGLFFLGRRWAPPANDGMPRRAAWSGLLLVAIFALAFPVLPNLAILQTDAAVTLGFVVTVLAALRYHERPTTGRAAALGAAAGLAAAVKLSGILVAPAVAVALLAPRRSDEEPGERPRPRLARLPSFLGHVLVVGFVAFAGLEATYAAANLDYDPALGRRTLAAYCKGEGTLVVEDRLYEWHPRLDRLERLDPFLAQYLTGLLGVRAQNAIGVYPSYALGRVTSEGRWWYFPVLLAVKTPLVLIAVAGVAATLALLTAARSRERRRWRLPSAATWIVVAPVALYLGTTLTSNYNLGFRHLLPILPFLALPLVRWLAKRPRAAVAVVAVLALESALLAPLWMSATNTWFLGDANPTRFAFGAGNLDYRQNFVALGEAAEARGIERLGVLYPALPPAAVRAYVPGGYLAYPTVPLEPGWYAVSTVLEQLVPAVLAADDTLYDREALAELAAVWEPYWQTVAAGEDHGYVAGSFHLYRLP